MPLSSAGTTMDDQGDYLQNAEGVVQTQVQSVYHANQKLVSVSLAGTGFSFSPQMLDAYDPQPVETVSPEPSATPEASAAPEHTSEPNTMSTPTDMLPDATVFPDSAEHPEDSPAVSPTTETAATEEPTEINAIETPASSNEEQNTPTPSVTASQTEEQVQTPVVAEETTLSAGYGKTTRGGKLYLARSGEETLGTLRSNVILYIVSVPGKYRAEIIFDTPAGLIKGFYPVKQLKNLSEAEEAQAIAAAKAQTETATYSGYPLPRTDGYTPNDVPTEETPQPETTPKPTEQATEQPNHTPAAVTETPATTESIPATENPDTESQHTEPTATITAEPTAIPATAEPKPTEVPARQEEQPTVTDESAESHSATEQSSEPLPAVSTEQQPVPEQLSSPEQPTVPEQHGENTGSSLLPKWFGRLIPSAYAEVKPSSIAGVREYASSGTKTRRARSLDSVSGITYPGLFDAVTDVHLSVSTTGVKEDIKVHQYTGNHVYAYRLETEGLTAAQSGQEILLSYHGQPLAKLDAPYMTDANGARSTDIAVTLEGSGGSYVVTYRPNDEWMKNAAYPVVIDPSGSYFNDLATNIGDVYVTAGQPDRHYAHTVAQGSQQSMYELEGNNLFAGTHDGGSIAYVIPSLVGFSAPPATAFPENTGLLISEAKWKFNVRDLGGNAKFRVALVTGDWNTSTVTYNSRPTLSSSIYVDVTLRIGWNEVDVTKLFSAWFNALDQKRNYGIAISSNTAWAKIQSSDILPRADRMRFEATYYTGVSKPAVQAKADGHGVNSESGWVDLNWNAVAGASGYVLGVYNGKKYEYRSLGNVRSFTTKGKKLWPTEAEIAAGSFALHWDGTGQELPNIPRKGQSDLNYYFRVLPANAYGQVADSNTAGTASLVLPDTMPPSQPATLSVSPAGWSNAETRTITWAGIKDLPTNSASLGTGHI